MNKQKKIYLDHAATSYPKPESVYSEVDRFARQIGIGGARGNYRENRLVAEIITEVRELLGKLLNCGPGSIIFTSGATFSMNLLLQGVLRPGDHVVISPFEHNSVLRPLKFLVEKRQIKLTVLPGDIERGIDLDSLDKAITPRTRLCILNHITNSFGTVQPVVAAGKILQNYQNLFFIVDAAQSLGTHPVDVERLRADALCFSGHKGVLGPTGTGGFYISPEMVDQVDPLILGGTGRNGGTGIYSSELPHKYEVGTQNSWGLVGLREGLRTVVDQGIDRIDNRIDSFTTRASRALQQLSGIELFLPAEDNHHGIISFQLDTLSVADTGLLLDKLFNIKVRAGLHCSPGAHRRVGTYPQGTVRASFSWMNEKNEIDSFTDAVAALISDSR